MFHAYYLKNVPRFYAASLNAKVENYSDEIGIDVQLTIDSVYQ
jgi:hypothetical protein